MASRSAQQWRMAANSAKSGSCRDPTFAEFGVLKGKARRVSCIGESFLVHWHNAAIIAGRHSAKRILAKLFLRYAPEMRTKKTLSAAAFSLFAHCTMFLASASANHVGCS